MIKGKRQGWKFKFSFKLIKAWHVQVFLGSTVREYTPVSSARAWEDGSLDLLVKTYPDGTVSRFFGTLRTVQEAREAALQSYAPLEEQNLGETLLLE